ncbi:MAG: phage major capsid protein [Oscillospiraceae bacterium]|jgi:HK97 family phage major capsid protein|nr:phage major capsid protein [Oscillospiraceae bacterium]
MAKKKARKGVKTDVTELATVLADELEKRKSRKEDDEDVASEIPAGLVDVLEEAITIADEKRKARKEADGEDADLTPDDMLEIAEEVAALIDEDKAEEEEDEEKGDDPEVEEEEPKGKGKAASGKRTAKHQRPPAPAQRKYSDIYLGGPRGATPGTDFKSRAAALTGAKKKSFVYEGFGRAVKCLSSFANGDPEQASYFAEKTFGDDALARAFKAQTATVPSGGGYLIPEEYSTEIIELLYAQTVISDLGARRIAMDSGSINMPRMTAGVPGTWIGEDRDIPESKAKYGNLKLTAKKLGTIVPLSNDLLRSTHYTTDQMVGSDMTRRMALAIDQAALYGTGGEFQPMGLANMKGVTAVSASSLAADYASGGVLTSSFPAFVEGAVLDKNVDESNMGWAFNARTEFFFKNIKSATGEFIFLDEMNTGRFMGYPYRRSSLIPTASNKTGVFFGNWGDMIIAEQGSLMVETSREASYYTDDGKQVSAFSRDETLIRAIQLVDVGVRHVESFHYTKDVVVPGLA